MNAQNVKLILILAILSMTGATSLLVWKKAKEAQPTANITHRQQRLSVVPPAPKIPEVVNEFNRINSEINSFSAEDMRVYVWENGMRFRVSGTLHYEKPKCFRMQIESILADEMDIGANNEVFWYWSRKDKHPGLYFATYADYHKTRLKTPFNPMFLRESLGLDEIDPKTAKIIENENDVMLVWPKISSTGKGILYAVILNKANCRMAGIIISNSMGNPLASCEVEYDGNLPVKIVYNWQEEKRSLILEFKRPSMNQTIPSSVWELPGYRPRINMGEEFQSH